MLEITNEDMRWLGFVYVGAVAFISIGVIGVADYIKTKRELRKCIKNRVGRFTR